MTIYHVYSNVSDGEIQFLCKTKNMNGGDHLVGIGEDNTVYEPYIVRVNKDPYLFTMAIFDCDIDKNNIKVFGMPKDRFTEKIDSFSKRYELLDTYTI